MKDILILIKEYVEALTYWHEVKKGNSFHLLANAESHVEDLLREIELRIKELEDGKKKENSTGKEE